MRTHGRLYTSSMDPIIIIIIELAAYFGIQL